MQQHSVRNEREAAEKAEREMMGAGVWAGGWSVRRESEGDVNLTTTRPHMRTLTHRLTLGATHSLSLETTLVCVCFLWPLVAR